MADPAALRWRVGELFVITGPNQCWRPEKRGGWQPRAWSSHVDDPASSVIRKRDLEIDFSQEFRIMNLRRGRRFLQAQVVVSSPHAGDLRVWINLEKDLVPWAARPPA